MKKPASERGLLAGLPIPIKDLTNVAGVLTTQGSPIYKDTIPEKSDLAPTWAAAYATPRASAAS
jgi:amidase